jgi:hypothetical protein
MLSAAIVDGFVGNGATPDDRNEKGETIMIHKICGTRLTDEYWDCECVHDYIHSAKTKRCNVCGTNSDEGSYSHADEVLAEELPLDETVLQEYP